MTLYVAIEAGGTKFVCGLGNTRAGSLGRAVIETHTPDETFAQVAAFFAEAGARHGPPAALGIATFGPVELDHASAAYGRILRTAKPGWEGCDVLARTRRFFAGATGLETDVNAADIAEAAHHGVSQLAYVTVGAGIGVGLVIDGAPVHGLGHPKAGHVLVRCHPRQEASHGSFAGVCLFHGDCPEGPPIAPAICAFTGRDFATIPADDPVWAIEANSLAQLSMTLLAIVAPHRIALSGGVSAGPGLLERICAAPSRCWRDTCTTPPTLTTSKAQSSHPPAASLRVSSAPTSSPSVAAFPNPSGENDEQGNAAKLAATPVKAGVALPARSPTRPPTGYRR
jgi:fructokinase